MSRLTQIFFAAIAVTICGAGATAAAPVTVGTFSLYNLDYDLDSVVDLSYVDLVNLMGEGSALGFSVTLTGTLQLCTGTDVTTCTSTGETRSVDPPPLSYVDFVTDPMGDPATVGVRMILSIASLSPDITLSGALSVSGDGYISLGCDDTTGNPCTQYIYYDAAVPEPATLALLASGLGALAIRRRRSR